MAVRIAVVTSCTLPRRCTASGEKCDDCDDRRGFDFARAEIQYFIGNSLAIRSVTTDVLLFVKSIAPKIYDDFLVVIIILSLLILAMTVVIVGLLWRYTHNKVQDEITSYRFLTKLPKELVLRLVNDYNASLRALEKSYESQFLLGTSRALSQSRLCLSGRRASSSCSAHLWAYKAAANSPHNSPPPSINSSHAMHQSSRERLLTMANRKECLYMSRPAALLHGFSVLSKHHHNRSSMSTSSIRFATHLRKRCLCRHNH